MALPIAPELPSLDTFGGTFSDASSVVDAETELAATRKPSLEALAQQRDRVTLAAGRQRVAVNLIRHREFRRPR
jgi:hypothetical protein